jgi:lysozyme
MKTNRAGIELIKKFEGLRLTAYLCPAGHLTIGYGHTGEEVYPGQRISEEEAIRLLIQDIEGIEEGLKKLLKVKLNTNQFSALVSFTFNVGLGNLAKSTLLAIVNRSEDPTQEFLKWVFARGKPLPGLKVRRNAEARLYNLV